MTAYFVGTAWTTVRPVSPWTRRINAAALAVGLAIGMLPLARRDVDRFRHITMLIPRLNEQALSVRQQRSLVHRPAFDETLTWLEIFGTDPDLIEVWKEQKAEHGSAPPHGHAPHGGHHGPPDHRAEGPADGLGRPRRRRRRRGRSRHRKGPAPS